MVNTRKKESAAEADKKSMKHEKLSHKGQTVQNAGHDNGKQKAKKGKATNVSRQTPSKKKMNQKKKGSKSHIEKKKQITEARFREQGENIVMAVGTLPKSLVDQFAEPEDGIHGIHGSSSGK